jgi:carboxyl-terminal processing protease
LERRSSRRGSLMRAFALALALTASIPVHANDCTRLNEFDQMARTVTERFYDKSFRGHDWNATVARHRNAVDCARDERTLARVVNDLLKELKASHTAVYTADDLDYWAMQSIFSRDLDAHQIPFSGIWPAQAPPLRSGQAEGEWYAKYVLPGTPAADAGISVGDRLIRLDGKPFEPLGFSDGGDSILVISPEVGSERAVRIRATKQSIQRAFLDATRRSERLIRVDTKKIGYFHLWSGTHPLFLESLNIALARFEAQQIDALILDLRGGFGGSSLEYLEKLKKTAYFADVEKFALIDDGARSGKELLAGSLRHEKIATLVGSTTAGAFLGGSPFRFADDKYLLMVAVGAFVPPGIGPIEGIGIAADVAVAPCRAYCRGQDPQLDAVIELIRELT